MNLPPNAGECVFLGCCVPRLQEWDLNDDGVPETLRLGFARRSGGGGWHDRERLSGRRRRLGRVSAEDGIAFNAG